MCSCVDARSVAPVQISAIGDTQLPYFPVVSVRSIQRRMSIPDVPLNPVHNLPKSINLQPADAL